jgi:uncharacterized membrane protein YebE (DUF533 family)
MTEEARVSILHIVASVILADGMITDAEHDFLERLSGSLGLDAEQRKKVLSHVNIDEPIDPIVAKITEDTDKVEALRQAAGAMLVDGDIARPERALLERMADTLGVGTAMVQDVINQAKADA